MSPARGTRAIIPVAGVGTRLRPHTHTMPKALIHVAGKPILAHILDDLPAPRDPGAWCWSWATWAT